jgi:hypothetical protein
MVKKTPPYMKKFSSLLLFIFLACSRLNAQTAFSTIDSVEINNITASVLVHGDMWWDPAAGAAFCKFPAHGKASIGFTTALWMSGYDAGNNLHIAAQTYRQNGNDYWPGPLDASDTLTYATSQNWAKISKVNRTDIQYFLGLSTHTTSNTPSAILTWPAKGNAYAAGNAGAALTITTDMAPFVDLNGNGLYEPLLGEYPKVPGDQALWWVFSDNGPSHGETHGKPLGIETHVMAYGFHRGTLIDNVLYYDYTLVNKSHNDYHNMRTALWDDFDLGWAFDDYIGFDSVHRMGIGYNATNDDGAGGGHPVNTYGLHPPVMGVTMLVLPGDAGSSYVPVGSFSYFRNDFSEIGNPMTAAEHDGYMRATLRDGEHISNDFAGSGVPSKGYGAGPNCNYVFPGDPSDNTAWSECNSNNPPGDRRFIISSADFTLNAGATQHVVMALVTTDTSAGGGCPGVSFNNIKIVADTAWKTFRTLDVPAVSHESHLAVYPNPAHDRLIIENSGNGLGEESIAIYNAMGQVMSVPITGHGHKREADIGALPVGLYYLRYGNDKGWESVKFLKN